MQNEMSLFVQWDFLLMKLSIQFQILSIIIQLLCSNLMLMFSFLFIWSRVNNKSDGNIPYTISFSDQHNDADF